MNHRADDILEAVTALTGVSRAEMLSSQRSNRVVQAREVLVGALRQFCTRLSFPEIASSFFARRFHGSVYFEYQNWLRMHEIDRDEWLWKIAVLSEVASANRLHAERQTRLVEAELKWVVRTPKAKRRRRAA